MAFTDNNSYAVGRGRLVFTSFFRNGPGSFVISQAGEMEFYSFSKQGHQKFLGSRFWIFCFFGLQNLVLPEFFHSGIGVPSSGTGGKLIVEVTPDRNQVSLMPGSSL